MAHARRNEEPWDHPAPRGTHSQPLSAAAKASARQHARAAGRPYPNLVDNIQAAKRQKARAETRDPAGGLTPAGRAAFKRRDGAQLQPGVTKLVRDMTPEEMRRKGSWATRFFGRAELPPLRDPHGKPTRFALSAHAWGEPVPRTEAAARRIAEKGRRLLARYKRLRER
ncbi:DUF6321 domain-containing protein [Pseudorhodoferax soli]|uniref:DUF6321 domain-containing protein n=1 Tax=Pseudorhodoferax soli TaxID=545864 RepID=A0A368XHW3_9BURK|nr:DUF6321 domain-containing protein [Pseudorhodoferax soli]RCW65594.1 hypothetical protein DES41_11245 [Pseudorhodoferax soli]